MTEAKGWALYAHPLFLDQRVNWRLGFLGEFSSGAQASERLIGTFALVFDFLQCRECLFRLLVFGQFDSRHEGVPRLGGLFGGVIVVETPRSDCGHKNDGGGDEYLSVGFPEILHFFRAQFLIDLAKE